VDMEELMSPTIIFCDNQAAISISKQGSFHGRTKHIELRFHWLRDQVEAKKLELEYVSTEDNVADLMTKAVPKDKHKRMVELIGLKEVPQAKPRKT